MSKNNNLNMFCISMEPVHLNFIQSLNYLPVGLGTKNFTKDWLRDNTGKNISINELAIKSKTIPYEILNNIGNRVKKIYIENE